jgi:hypothetical protein
MLMSTRGLGFPEIQKENVGDIKLKSANSK